MMGTGLYYSTDEANTWTKSAMSGVKPLKKYFRKVKTTSLFFNNQGTLFVGGYSNQAYLLKLNVDTKKTDEVKLPVLTEDAVAYFAQNPVVENEMAFATFNKNVYISNDKGLNWQKIADQGKGISSENH